MHAPKFAGFTKQIFASGDFGGLFGLSIFCLALMATPSQLLDFFVELFPAFRETWDDLENNMNRNGDDFTAHGLCAEFSRFYIDRGLTAEVSALERLFHRIEALIADDPDDQDSVANALCTCFLENIAQLPVGEKSLPLMGPESRKFFSYWHTSR